MSQKDYEKWLKANKPRHCEHGLTNTCYAPAGYKCDECGKHVCFDHIHLFRRSVMCTPPLCSRCNAIRLTGKKSTGHYYDDGGAIVKDYRVNVFNRCLTCGSVHPECRTADCHNPTHCPPDERGEPFTYCDTCDAAMADTDGRAVQS